ncbi:uncharacterized protein F4822DRAFT_199741 [Hypoxylon trugodes]|uniref:uncharacterized protein n=1 Tax=Hypoxylon trugodes TaxID=326681 RepID=UPI00219EEC96|nr:uncharacterized protein F4822DRAFT_199741 [Hypoxylon trugodes]KAI1389423.1 hypothetical protein F4822DRAFT_199741 [Hypoxylon trugodes]
MATDPGLDGEESISSKCHNLIRKLNDLIDLLKEKEATDGVVVTPTSVSDVLDRFSLWCGNLGALHKPTKKLSLDQRLADAPDVKDQILVNIDDFNEAIEDLSGIILGDNPNREISSNDDYDDLNDDGGAGLHDDDDPPMDEAHMNLELMAEAMRSLFQLGVLVRKSGPRDRFQKALQQSTISYPEFFDVNYVEQKYSKLYKAEDRRLSTRLGSANAKRRQFMTYCREHKARLDAHDDDDAPVIRDGATEKLSSKATTFIQNTESGATEPITGEEDDAISIMTATTTFNSDTKLKLPSLAEVSSGEDSFECPICFTLQSIETEKSWKIHAFRDLKAYICTVGGTECNSLFFGDRNAWFEHELQNHRSRYNCTLCDRKGFQSKASFMEHISSTHGSFPQDQLSALADASCVIPSLFNARDCPFCDDWASVLQQRQNTKGKRVDNGIIQDVFVPAAKFKRHVATHQEQLAIFVVPRSSDPDADENVGSDSTTARLEEQFPIDASGSGENSDMDELPNPGDTPFDTKTYVRTTTSVPSDTQSAFSDIDVENNDDAVDDEASGDPTAEARPDPFPSKDADEGVPTVTEDEFNYITSDDLEQHGFPKDDDKPTTNSDPDPAPAPDPDVLRIKIGDRVLLYNFPAYSIGDGKLRVIDLRNQIGRRLQLDVARTHLLGMSYKGRELENNDYPLRNYGVKNNSIIDVVLPKAPFLEDLSEEDSPSLKSENSNDGGPKTTEPPETINRTEIETEEAREKLGAEKIQTETDTGEEGELNIESTAQKRRRERRKERWEKGRQEEEEIRREEEAQRQRLMERMAPQNKGKIPRHRRLDTYKWIGSDEEGGSDDTNQPEGARSTGSGLDRENPEAEQVPPKKPPADSPALRELAALERDFNTNYLPQCQQFSANPPGDYKQLEKEHRRISETIMQEILLKLDGIETEGIPEVRARRKGLVAYVHTALKDIDKHLRNI